YCIANAAAVVYGRRGGFRQFMSARLRRIYPACWAALLLTAALAALAELLVRSGHLGPSNLANIHVTEQGPLYFFANFTLTQGVLGQQSLIYQTWTLCYEMAFYLLVGCALTSVGHRMGERAILTRLHAVTVGTLLLLLISPTSLRYPLDLWPQF